MSTQKAPRAVVEELREEKLNLSKSFNRSLELLATGLFTREGQFFYEMIQNAEDCSESPGTTVEIEIQSDGVVIRNDGQTFDEEDVRSVCDVGRTLKKESDDNIGFWGIGFKSVFRVTDEPHVLSEGYQFKFSRDHWQPQEDEESVPWRVTPLWVEDPPVEPRDEWNTFYLPYADGAEDQVVEGANSLQNHLLLFLDDIETIRVVDRRDGKTGEAREMEVEERQSICGGERYELSNGERWWVYEERYDVPEHVREDRATRERARQGIESRPMRIAVEIDDDGTLEYQTEGSVHTSVFSFLPLEGVTSGMPFVIDADLITGAGRTKPNQGAAWNEWTMKTIGKELVPSAIECLQDHDDWQYQFHDALIPSERPNGQLFRILDDSIFETLKQKDIIPTDDGNWVSPSDAAHVVADNSNREDDLRELVSTADLMTLADRRLTHERLQMQARLHGERLPIRRFGLDGADVKDSGRTLVESATDETWLQERATPESAAWFRELYDLLSNADIDDDTFEDVPIVYIGDSEVDDETGDGTLVTPEEAYLRTQDDVESVLEDADDREAFTTVPKDIRQSFAAVNFLRETGVSSAGPEALVELITDSPELLGSLTECENPVASFRRLYAVLDEAKTDEVDGIEIVYTGSGLVDPSDDDTEVYLPADGDQTERVFGAVDRSLEALDTVPEGLVDTSGEDERAERGEEAEQFLQSLGVRHADASLLAERLRPEIVGDPGDALDTETLVTYTGIVAQVLDDWSETDTDEDLLIATEKGTVRPASEVVCSQRYGAPYETGQLLDRPVPNRAYEESAFGDNWSELFSAAGVADGTEPEALQTALGAVQQESVDTESTLRDLYDAVESYQWGDTDPSEIELFTEAGSFRPATEVFTPDDEMAREQFDGSLFAWVPDHGEGEQGDIFESLHALGVESAEEAHESEYVPGEEVTEEVSPGAKRQIRKCWAEAVDGIPSLPSDDGENDLRVEWVESIEVEHTLGEVAEPERDEADRYSHVSVDRQTGTVTVSLARTFGLDRQGRQSLAASIIEACNTDRDQREIAEEFVQTTEDAAVSAVVGYERDRVDQENGRLADVRQNRMDHAGYDVFVCEATGDERHIEIKSLSSGGNITLRPRQIERCRNDDDFCLYVVVNPQSDATKLYVDESPDPDALRRRGAELEEVLSVPRESWEQSSHGPIST